MKKRLPKRTILLAGMLLLVLGVGAFTYSRMKDEKKVVAGNGSEINYKPPTEEEIKQAEHNKDSIIQQTDQTPRTSSSGKKQVNVVITNTNQSDQDVTIIAYVQGIFENGGTCTATLTQGSNTVTKKVEAFADASTTVCAPYIISRSEFVSTGDWQLVVTYSSATAEGISQPKVMKINKS